MHNCETVEFESDVRITDLARKILLRILQRREEPCDNAVSDRCAVNIAPLVQGFPFSLKTSHALKIREQHVITVTGKAFYDFAHAPANHSNRRTTPKEYAVWEIHPVMALHVDQ
jgi:hypothetical protein